MPLSCDCDVDYDWYADPCSDFSVYPARSGCRCESCGASIQGGDDCLRFDCYEVGEFGDEILRPAGETCRSCRHRTCNEMYSGRRYYKCGLMPGSHGPATDIVLKSPACSFWEVVND